MLTAQDGVLIPISIIWVAVPSVGFGANVTHGAPAVALLPLLPFFLIGLYLVAGRFVLDAMIRRETEYVITGHRVLIPRRKLWPVVRAINLDRLAETQMREHPSGRGTITFGAASPAFAAFGRGFGFGVASLDPAPRLLAIDDVRRVYALIQDRRRDLPGT